MLSMLTPPELFAQNLRFPLLEMSMVRDVLKRLGGCVVKCNCDKMTQSLECSFKFIFAVLGAIPNLLTLKQKGVL